MKNKHLPFLFKSVLFSLIPIIVFCVFMGVQGVALWDLDATASLWNDEFYYFKQLEGLSVYGMPLGYFGYNGSTAAVGTLGAWSIFLLLPYLPFMSLLDYSPQAVLYINLFFVFLACIAFYYLAKPSRWQCFLFALVFCASPFVIRFSLSCMVELFFYSGVIVLAGLVLHLSKKDRPGIMIWAFYALVLYLSLCRPYFLAFLLFGPSFQWRRSVVKALLAPLFALIIFALLYIGIVVKLQAPYLSPLIDASIFEHLLQGELYSFLLDVFHKLYSACRTVLGFVFSTFYITSHSYRSADTNYLARTAGSCYLAFFICILFLIVYLVLRMRKIRKAVLAQSDRWLVIISLLVSIAVLLAIIFLYDLSVGSRHLILLFLFLALIIIMLPHYDSRLSKSMLAVFFLLFASVQWISVNDSLIFSLPTAESQGTNMPIESDANLLTSEIVLSPNSDPWDNTVYYEYPFVKFSYCYDLPAGIGIQFVVSDYLTQNAQTLPGRYVLTSIYSGAEQHLVDLGWKPVIQATEYVLLERPSVR